MDIRVPGVHYQNPVHSGLLVAFEQRDGILCTPADHCRAVVDAVDDRLDDAYSFVVRERIVLAGVSTGSEQTALASRRKPTFASSAS